MLFRSLALGHPTKGPELARILKRFRKRHLDLIVGRVMEGIRLAEEMDRQDAARRAAEDSTPVPVPAVQRAPRAAVVECRGEVVSLDAHRRRGFAVRPSVRPNDFRPIVSRGPPPRFALAA